MTERRHSSSVDDPLARQDPFAMGDSSQFERVYRHAGRLAEGVDEALVGGAQSDWGRVERLTRELADVAAAARRRRVVE
jgi:hypothetical protein